MVVYCLASQPNIQNTGFDSKLLSTKQAQPNKDMPALSLAGNTDLLQVATTSIPPLSSFEKSLTQQFQLIFIYTYFGSLL